ncbi:DsbA family oxidoreductase [Rhodohalobacter sp. SW132]|uniref:DsbA family oxidoreductase n=1 Tax=Rhodohalobacter sp. SW132 TaxID=2293433 RepID=UPI000E24ACA4|nr:DsbA family oxidoreductase [Rhodohalobacter sp. SW132]REL38241.1 DsbA family oxidoreductase [Rhodohalobacter sp. SW132]
MNNLENLNPDQKTTAFTVDIWSDIVCPFCYIGKRNFENALDQTGLTDNVNVVWHSFELAPDAETKPNATIYEELGKRKGWSLEQSKQIHKQMEQRARESGLEYDFDKTVPANSFKAHRLLHLAKKNKLQNEVKELLLKGYFIDGKNIDSDDFLVETARQAGLNEEEVHKALQSDSIEKEILEDITNARKLGIQGVPFFILNEKYSISGAQPVEVFTQALEKLKDELNLRNISDTDGAVCGPDKKC